jgi:hypothetical protein
MSLEEKTLKAKTFKSIEDTTRPTRDGELSTLIREERMLLADITKTSVSISAEHSISDQDFQ